MKTSFLPILYFMAEYMTGYGANAKTQAQLDALPKAVMTDFRIGLSYKYARRIGENKDSDGPPAVFTDRFELITVVVQQLTVNVDLLEFQNYVWMGNAYSPVMTTTTTTTTIP